jgi:hypothetical protein
MMTILGRAAIATVAALAAVVPQTLAQWVEPPGRGWADLTTYHVDTRERFEFNGDKRSFFADGHAVSTSVFLTIAGGIVPGVDAWMQAPYNRLRFDDASGERVRSGIGDTRLYLRVQPLTYLGSGLPFAIRGGVKVAVGDFDVGSEIIPLGDGQTDWELMGELGHSFYPIDAYVNGWVGYRWRELNTDSRQDFGNEVFYLAQAGGNYGRVGLQLILDGLETVTTPIIEGVALPNAERSLVQLTSRVTYQLGPGALSAGARFSLSGKNLPAGTALVLGYFTRWPIGS